MHKQIIICLLLAILINSINSVLIPSETERIENLEKLLKDLQDGLLENHKQVMGEINKRIDQYNDQSIKLKEMNKTIEDLRNQTNKQNDINTTIEELKRTKEQLINTENIVVVNEKSLDQTNVRLIETQKDLKQTKEKFNNLLDNLFNKWLHFKLFTDSEGKRKAFFIPMNEMYERRTFDEAINTCNKYDSHLVEPKTVQKQHIFETFFGQLGLAGNKMPDFWINAKKDSSGKFRWISTGEEFTFTNWTPERFLDQAAPFPVKDWNYVWIYAYRNQSDFANVGKWGNQNDGKFHYVACEREIYI